MEDPAKLIDEYVQERNYVDNEKPYWLFVDAQDELQYNLFSYFPDAHYRKAINQAYQQQIRDEELVPDGGTQTQYYWSGENGILYHTETSEDQVNPFFDTVEQAEQFLEYQADQYGEDRYQGLVLRKTGNQKVMEATEVLTQQSGLGEFAPDGGQQIDEFYQTGEGADQL